MPPIEMVAHVEASEENPALVLSPMPPTSAYPRAFGHVSELSHAQPAITPTHVFPPVRPMLAPAAQYNPSSQRPLRRSQKASRTGLRGCWCCLSILVIITHCGYACFIYGYAKAESRPLPRSIVNQTVSGFAAFQAFMYLSGMLAACVDVYIMTSCCSGQDLFCGCIALLPKMIILFCAIPWICGNKLTKSSFAHACDSDWLQISLTGHTYANASGRNIAEFSLVETGELLWTWTSNDPFQNDFNLVAFNSTNPSLLPSLGNITINHATNELTRAWCYNKTTSCATGYVWPFDGLSFEVHYNGTLSRMKNRYRNWSFDNAPSVLMHRVDEDGRLAERLMHTSIARCQRMKLCVSHAMKRQDGIVSADTLVAAYWLLHKQAIYATKCTRSRDR